MFHFRAVTGCAAPCYNANGFSVPRASAKAPRPSRDGGPLRPGRLEGRGGVGRGFRNMFFATGLPGWARSGVAGTAGAADEKQVLTSQADALRAQLDGIQKRLEQLDSGASTQG